MLPPRVLPPTSSRVTPHRRDECPPPPAHASCAASAVPWPRCWPRCWSRSLIGPLAQLAPSHGRARRPDGRVGLDRPADPPRPSRVRDLGALPGSDARSSGLRPKIADALAVPGVVGLSVRFPWNAVDLRGRRSAPDPAHRERRIASGRARAVAPVHGRYLHPGAGVPRRGVVLPRGRSAGPAGVRQQHRRHAVFVGAYESTCTSSPPGRARTTYDCSTCRGTARTGPSSTTAPPCARPAATPRGSGSGATGS